VDFAILLQDYTRIFSSSYLPIFLSSAIRETVYLPVDKLKRLEHIHISL